MTFSNPMQGALSPDVISAWRAREVADAYVRPLIFCMAVDPALSKSDFTLWGDYMRYADGPLVGAFIDRTIINLMTVAARDGARLRSPVMVFRPDGLPEVRINGRPIQVVHTPDRNVDVFPNAFEALFSKYDGKLSFPDDLLDIPVHTSYSVAEGNPKWHNLAITRDSNNVCHYVDGVLVKGTPNSPYREFKSNKDRALKLKRKSQKRNRK